MTSSGRPINRYLGVYRRPGRFDIGLAAELPQAYRKFWNEWKLAKRTPVHHIEEEGRWRRNPDNGEITDIVNVPLKVKFPEEADSGLWGGEGIVQGFAQKKKARKPHNGPVPKLWFPQLKRTVVKSEVLDKYLSVIVTPRTINLINDHYGFDHYLLKTRACDLNSNLAFKLKKKILEALQDGCPAHSEDPTKQEEIKKAYMGYLASYTPEEIEWYGLTFQEALWKISEIKKKEEEPVPLKKMYRTNLIERLKMAQIIEEESAEKPEEPKSWLSRVNPFSKKET